MIPVGGVKFSWPVAREKLTEGSLSHGSQFLTEHRVTRRSGRFRSILDLMGLNASIFELFFFNWPKISHRFHFFSLVRT